MSKSNQDILFNRRELKTFRNCTKFRAKGIKMNYIYKKDQFLRNKISGNIVQLRQDTNKLDLNIWEIWSPRDGEYCWFANTGYLELNISPHLGKYGVLSYTLDYYDLCEPWTKNLPFGMK